MKNNELMMIGKRELEVLILNYISSNLETGRNRTRYIGEAFSTINKDDEGNYSITLEYRVFTEYNFDDGEKENFEDLVQINLKGDMDLSRKDMEAIKKEMYLNSINNAAFIVNILKIAKF